jgi:adenylate cyclase class IV
MKTHVHEIEVKYSIHGTKVNDIFDTLMDLGFRHKATYDLVDMWLPPKEKGESLRVREQIDGTSRKYLLSSKKSNEKDGEIKNKCEAESQIDDFIREVVIGLALRIRDSLPVVRKTRYHWQGRIGARDYTVAIDEVLDLGRFSGFYLEVETLVPADKADPAAKDDVKRIALQILETAYKAEENLTFSYVKLSYKKMAKIYQAEQIID